MWPALARPGPCSRKSVNWLRIKPKPKSSFGDSERTHRCCSKKSIIVKEAIHDRISAPPLLFVHKRNDTLGDPGQR